MFHAEHKLCRDRGLRSTGSPGGRGKSFRTSRIKGKTVERGNFQRTCKAPWKRSRSVSLTRNVDIPLDVWYKHQVHARRLVAVEEQKLPPLNESLKWVRVERDCEKNRLWKVAPAEIQTLSAKAIVKSTEQGIVPVRVKKSSVKFRGGNKQQTIAGTSRNVNLGPIGIWCKCGGMASRSIS